MLVLYVHGGVYADLDVELVAPVEDWPRRYQNISGAGFIAGNEGLGLPGQREGMQFCQWTLAARARHPLLVRGPPLSRGDGNWALRFGVWLAAARGGSSWRWGSGSGLRPPGEAAACAGVQVSACALRAWGGRFRARPLPHLHNR
jgi:hypothetical protein